MGLGYKGGGVEALGGDSPCLEARMYVLPYTAAATVCVVPDSAFNKRSKLYCCWLLIQVWYESAKHHVLAFGERTLSLAVVKRGSRSEVDTETEALLDTLG